MDEKGEYLYDDLLYSGRSLSLDEANDLEEKLKSNPADMESRALLIGYYIFENAHSSRAKRLQHALWFIENNPEVGIAGLGPFSFHPIFDGIDYCKARDLWLKNIREKPDSVRILDNAAFFFAVRERELAIELIKRAHTIEPNDPFWFIKLGNLYFLPIRDSIEKSIKYSEAALSEYEKAYNLISDEENRLHILQELAKSALYATNINKAEMYANQLLQLASKCNYCYDYGNAIHIGNSILGRIALFNCDIDGAKGYLLNSGRIPDSKEYITHDPSMVLAKELLELGEKEVVIEYLALCKDFWHDGQNQLEKWVEEIRNGCMPEFPRHLIR